MLWILNDSRIKFTVKDGVFVIWDGVLLIWGIVFGTATCSVFDIAESVFNVLPQLDDHRQCYQCCF